MPNFAEMAKVNVDDLPEVKLLPRGSYIWAVERVPETKETSKGLGVMVNFACRCVRPIDDFDGDEDELSEFGDVTTVKRTLGFYYPETPKEDEDQATLARNQAQSLKRLNDFLERHLQVEGSSLDERMSGAPNHQFIGVVKHEPDNRNPGEFVDRIAQTAPVE